MSSQRSASYSGTPLAKKLGYAEGLVVRKELRKARK